MSWRAVLLLAATLVAAPSVGAATTDSASDVDVKAAFVFNFAKFTEWPDLSATAPIRLCVFGDDQVAAALAALTHDRAIDQHPIEVIAGDVGVARLCHLLYISRQEPDPGPMLDARRGLPVLTVGDAERFAATGGMIQLFVESSKMRFAINVDAIQRSHLKLSSRVLGLAKIVKDDRAR